ncbi:hypothetical protein, partial [uncultured Pseudoalteromonas sp.]|uniref:hypothetical protein n=1 Tax=uncultured Pseudoalteromonas sp. TaxID=114053 RepID=UPI002595787E
QFLGNVFTKFWRHAQSEVRLNPQSRILCGFFYTYKSATFKAPASCTVRANRVAGANLAFGINFIAA